MAHTGHRVASTGLSLSVLEYDDHAGEQGAPHVLLLHGYPDSKELWRPVAERLAGAGMHVITYDVRGAGASDVPRRTSDYRTELLVDDLVAVLDVTVPDGERVHLVGHDWGSVQLWEAVLGEAEDPRLRGRIASFTSVSGPALEHLAHLIRHPGGRRLRLLRQLGHSWYVYAFQVPVLPELFWRTAGRLGGRGMDENGANGVNLYRANVLTGMRRGSPRRTAVPVLVVAPKKDPFLTDLIVEDLDRMCSQVRVERPDTGHWVPRSEPDLLAGLITEQVGAHR